MRLQTLGKRQAEVYRYVRDFWCERHYVPTQRQVAQAFHISQTSAREYIAILVRKGYLGQDPCETRGMWLKVIAADEEIPVRGQQRPPAAFTFVCPFCGAKQDAATAEEFTAAAEEFPRHRLCKRIFAHRTHPLFEVNGKEQPK